MAATHHLIDLGHTRIGVITGSNILMATRARLAGFRSAMEAAGLTIDETLIFAEELDEEASPEAGLSLLSRADRPTAIFATSDVKALGAYEAARILGLGIPDDVSIVGYDDLAIATGWSTPHHCAPAACGDGDGSSEDGCPLTERASVDSRSAGVGDIAGHPRKYTPYRPRMTLVASAQCRR